MAFAWLERGGPPVAPPSRQGFGTRLLQQVLRNQDGVVKFDFGPDGFPRPRGVSGGALGSRTLGAGPGSSAFATVLPLRDSPPARKR